MSKTVITLASSTSCCRRYAKRYIACIEEIHESIVKLADPAEYTTIRISVLLFVCYILEKIN